MNRIARFTSPTISGTVSRGWLPWTTAKTVYPRSSRGRKKIAGHCVVRRRGGIPPLSTSSTTAAPLAFFLGEKTSIVSAVPNLRP